MAKGRKKTGLAVWSEASIVLSPMTLANMRANCMRTLAAWCLGRGYNYR
jgi:hypothetical protein